MQIGMGLSLSGMGGGAPSLESLIAAMYASGEQGAWYDPSDWATLSQDGAGTTPVTAVGQPVGKMLDKSGRGNHARQPTAINRPVLQIDGNGKHYLAFNGTNSWMSTAAIDFTATDKMMVVAGVRKLSDAVPYGTLLESSANAGVNNGAFEITAPDASSAYGSYLRGSSVAGVAKGGFPSPSSAVLAALLDIGGATGAENGLRVNGAAAVFSTASAGVGNFGNYPLNIGARAGSTLFFNGQLYGLVVRGALSSDPQITSAERFMAGKTGVTL